MADSPNPGGMQNPPAGPKGGPSNPQAAAGAAAHRDAPKGVDAGPVEATSRPVRVGAVPVGDDPSAGAPVTPTALPRPKDGKLTRAHMEEAIRAGGSVLHDGEIIAKVEDLPDEADLAAGDAEREAAVAAALDEQIARLAAQRARLGGRGGADKPVK